MAPPTKLDDEMIERICQALRVGAYIETAAAHCGISKQSYYTWSRRGAEERERIADGSRPRKKEAVYVRMLDAVERAMADSELRDLATITAASQTQWQAAAWKLERKHPDRYGRRMRMDHGAAGDDSGGVISINVNLRDDTE